MRDDKYGRLCEIALGLDEKIKRQINGEKEHFIGASYPSPLLWHDYLLELRDYGFDNYPGVNIENPEAIFFTEKIIGCKMRHIGAQNDFFHTFCIPCIKEAGDIDKINVDLSESPAWNAYYGNIRAHLISPASELPICLPAFCPLDTACAIMGPAEFLELLGSDMQGAKHIIAFVCELYIKMVAQIKKLNIKTISANGYAGTYASDLNTVNISPKTLEQLIPFYEQIADFAGGMTLNIAVSDISLMSDIAGIASFCGFFFDSRLKLEDISKMLKKKLFVIYNYMFDDALNGVTLKDGAYINPIVHAHSRNIAEAFRELAHSHSIQAQIFRNDKNEAIDVANKLR